MAVSVCNECRGKISTNTEVCPHCGNKINKEIFNPVNICKINGIDYDFTPIMDVIMSEDVYKNGEMRIQLVSYLRELTNCAPIYSFYSKARAGNMPKEYSGETVDDIKRQAEVANATRPKCPTCGSTDIRSIGFGERTLSVNLFGLSSKKFNKTFECNHCGFTW